MLVASATERRSVASAIGQLTGLTAARGTLGRAYKASGGPLGWSTGPHWVRGADRQQIVSAGRLACRRGIVPKCQIMPMWRHGESHYIEQNPKLDCQD